MKKYDSMFTNALKFVRKIRPNVCPNLGFELQLKKYQEKLVSEHSSKQPSIVKQASHNEGSSGRSQLETKQMMLTFNAPTKERETARMAATNSRNFNGHTPHLTKKGHPGWGQKRAKVEEGGLFIEGRPAMDTKT